MPETDDLYEILQVHPSAHPEVIQAAYRRLAQIYHPDHNPSPDATQRMAEINRAYEILSDPARRAAYDRERSGQGGGYSTSGDVHEVIRAKSFELVNDMGNMRARLAINDEGEPELAMFDQNENYRWVGFQSNDGSSGLVLLDQNGKLRLRLGTRDNGLVFIDVSDGDENTRLWLGETDEGTPMLFMADQDGKRRFGIYQYENGKAILDVSDRNDETRLFIGEASDGTPMLWMADRNGNRRFDLSLTSQGSPDWTMYDRQGKPKIWAYIKDDGGLEMGKDTWW